MVSNIVRKKERPILTSKSKGQLDLSKLKDLTVKSLDDDKALNIEVIDISNQSALADYIIIASGTSSTQVTRMAEKLRERLEGRGVRNIRIEGAPQGDWVIMDAGDIIVHLFRPEVREFYNIEKMWSMDIPPSSLNPGFHAAP